MIKTTIGIAGMMCGMCESHINDVIRREFKVKKVSSSHTKGIAEIISENEIDEEKIKKAIADTGYDVTSFKSEPYEKKKGIFLSFQNNDIKKKFSQKTELLFMLLLYFQNALFNFYYFKIRPSYESFEITSSRFNLHFLAFSL